jgi:hypothetical protein
LPSIDLKSMTQTDVLSLRTFCPYGRFVLMDVLSLCTSFPKDVMSPDVLSRGMFRLPDVCPSGCFLPVRYVSGRFVWAPKYLILLRRDIEGNRPSRSLFSNNLATSSCTWMSPLHRDYEHLKTKRELHLACLHFSLGFLKCLHYCTLKTFPERSIYSLGVFNIVTNAL